MTNGLIHLYHGNGKGKTSAAIGLAIRAAGNHMKVVFLQFLKGSPSGEIQIMKDIPTIKVLRNSTDLGFVSNMTSDELGILREMHDSNLATAISLVESGQCDLLVLDEVCAAYRLNVVNHSLIDELVVNKPAALELVLTGREPCDLFIRQADYITLMSKVRHPYDKGIPARHGIEY